ncbi:lysosome-associated membrane glycoprotein 3 isoform X2 [Ascaphus truei]|uniref:lysosome-associated membrane glycoprotein 3 isoform X2 n=1 Tax=Ascaphus truei TaxID=8439 RepID=UPI003F5A66EC
MDRVVLMGALLFSGILLHMGDATAPIIPANTTNTTTTTASTPANTTTAHTTNTTTTTASTPANTTTAHTTANTTTAHTTANTTTAHTTANTTTAHTTANTTTAHTTANTTTAHTTANTTTAHTTTAHTTNTTTPFIPTLPPKPSPPTTGNYSVKTGNNTCIKALMGLELELDFSAQDHRYFNVEPNSSRTAVTGTCGANKANLNLTFPEGSINFMFVKEEHIYYISEVSVRYKLSPSIIWYGNASNQKLFKTDNRYAVTCKHAPAIKLSSSMSLVMTDVKLQAFGINNNTFGKESTCSADYNVIAPAIAVTVVVVIILGLIMYAVYLKIKSSGYQRI